MNTNPNLNPPPVRGESSNSCLKAGLIGCGALAAVGAIGFVIFLVWLSTGPEGRVRMANQMEDYATEYLEEHAILNETENLIAYYDASLSLDSSDAIVLTNERLIHHKSNRDDITVRLTEVEGFSHFEESLIGDVFQINSKDGAIMKFEVAIFNEGKAFKDALERQLELAQAGPNSEAEAEAEADPKP